MVMLVAISAVITYLYILYQAVLVVMFALYFFDLMSLSGCASAELLCLG